GTMPRESTRDFHGVPPGRKCVGRWCISRSLLREVPMRFIHFAAAFLILSASVLLAEDGGTLKGTVKYDGEPPAPKMKDVPPNDQPGCKCKTVADESLVVDPKTKGLKWAIVRILDGKPATPPAKPAE